MRKNNVLQFSRLKEIYRKKRNAKIKKAGIIFLIFILFVTGVSLLSANEKINIQTVNISGNNVLTKDDILKVVDKELAGKYLFLFSKRNSFIYPGQKITNSLLESFNRISDVQIAKNDLTTITISIKERTGIYLFCGQEGSEGEVENCYYIDSAGLIFSDAPYFSGNVYFKFYDNRNQKAGEGDSLPEAGREDVALTDPIGLYFIDKGEFTRLVNFKKYLDQYIIKSNALILKNNEEYEFVLNKMADENQFPKIFINKNSDFEKILNNLLSAIETEPFASEYKKNYNNLEYIDLRFENKVYYKFK